MTSAYASAGDDRSRRPAARLRRSRCDGPGISRRRAGRGFTYRWSDGRPVTEPDVRRRIDELVLPPAWTDVWICPWPNGHIQAMGTDAAGRRQYRYHDAWRLRRDAEKHDRVLAVAGRLPRLRAKVAEDLSADGYGRRRVLAATVRLLDLGFFRVGGEEYADDESGGYGLATLRKEHVRVDGEELVFEYDGKSGKHRVQSIVDDAVRDVVIGLKRRRGGGPELFAYRDGGRWRDVRSDDINAHLRELAGVALTAKDFRTWHATVLMAVALAVSSRVSTSPTARRRAISRAYREVADYLGNTPAVCRRSYVDPRVVDLYEDGVTIARVVERLETGRGAGDGGSEAAGARWAERGPAMQRDVERAVRGMLARHARR